MDFLIFLVILPLVGLALGLWLATRAKISGKLALAFSFLPITGFGLARLFC